MKKYILQIVIIIALIIIVTYALTHPKIEIKEVKVPEYIETEVEVVKEVKVEIEPTYVYKVTSSEREMLARLVYREGNAESLECQKAIISVLFNRLNSGQWGDTINDVIYAKGQFSTASMLSYTTPTETNYAAVDYVLKNGPTLPQYVMYFRNAYHFNWNGYVGYSNIDNTYFGYTKNNVK